MLSTGQTASAQSWSKAGTQQNREGMTPAQQSLADPRPSGSRGQDLDSSESEVQTIKPTKIMLKPADSRRVCLASV